MEVTRSRREIGGKAALIAGDVTWYDKPRESVFQHVFGRIRAIKANQITRRYELCAYQDRYSKRLTGPITGQLWAPTTGGSGASMGRVNANVIKSVIDTAGSRIAKGKPRAFVLPTKGDYRLKRKARSMTRFLDGAMKGADAYTNSDYVFRDAGIFGTGAITMDPFALMDGILKTEWVRVDELFIDLVDGMKDCPREFHWVKAVYRAELLERFPERAKEINEARMAWRGEMAYMGKADMVECAFSWHLPSTPDAQDGRFVISIATCALVDEPYKERRPPILRFHWTPPTYGPFGDGIAKSLLGIQQAILDILRGVIKSIRMYAVPRIWINKMAGVNEKTITNEITVMEHAGEKPVFDTPPAAAPDIYQMIQWLIDYAYKQEGISQLSAQSEKPAGLNSGVAMRTYQDVETQRFALVGQRWEQYYMQLAQLIIASARKVYKDKGKLTVKVPGRGFIERMDWNDVSLEDDMYDLGVWPTNMLPAEPEGKLQTIQEYVSSGFMPMEVAISQLDLPILADWVAEMTAARDNIEMCLDSILDRGRYMPPDALRNLDLAVKMSLAAINNARTDEEEPHKVDMLIRFLNESLALKQQASMQQQAMQPAGQAPGGAVGQAAPPPAAPMAPTGSGPVQMPEAA